MDYLESGKEWFFELVEARTFLLTSLKENCVTISLFIGILLITVLLKLFDYKRFFKCRTQLVIRNIAFIVDRKNLLFELHFSANYSKKSRYFVRRCIRLLKMLPGACNEPLPPQMYTPFLRACANGTAELVVYMLEHGADMSVKTSSGDSAFYLATYNIATSKSNNFGLLKFLLAKGADINEPNNNGFTPLHVAAAKGHSELVRWLLYEGANAEPQSSSITPQHVAYDSGHTEIAAILNMSIDTTLSWHSFNRSSSTSEKHF